MKEQYRSHKKLKPYKVTEELDSIKRFQRDATLYLRLLMWISVIIGALVFGIFVRLLLFN